MRVETPLVRPGYESKFRCIGSACEDSCCTGWTVTFDQGTCRKYAEIPDGPLRVLLDQNLVQEPLLEGGLAPRQFAKVRLNAENACPFLNAEKLCRIQAEYGEGYLSTTCATYPRVVHRIDGIEEKSLSLSCPEAARLVLFSKDLMGARADKEYEMSWDTEAETESGGELGELGDLRGSGDSGGLSRYFWPIREFVMTLLTNRRYALWQRLFLVGIFVRQLDGASKTGPVGSAQFAAALGGFKVAIEEGGFLGSMETIHADLRLQLDAVLQLAGMRLPRAMVGQRFLDVLGWFTEGIGNGPGVDMKDLIRGYARAHRRYYEPFFDDHPYVLENFFVNAAFRTLFPFGLGVGGVGWIPQMERQFELLATQFALVKGLLIGVAGYRRKNFGAEDVVFTVQAASKHFEHHPAFLEKTHGLIAANGLDNLRGLTMLVRN